jgi:hypothetical protein
VPLKVGDRVRTAEGLKGEIALLTKDGVSAYVWIIDDKPGSHTSLYRLDALKKIGEVD